MLVFEINLGGERSPPLGLLTAHIDLTSLSIFKFQSFPKLGP